MLEALYNAVIVRPLESNEKTFGGGIIVPDLGKENNKLGEVIAVGDGYYSATGTFLPTMVKLGEVIAVGDGYYSATGTFLPTMVKVGDVVILPTMGFTKVEYEGEEYFTGPENSLLGRIKKEI